MRYCIISIFDKTEIVTGAHKRHVGLLKELKNRGNEIYLFSPIDFLNVPKWHFKITKHFNSKIPKSIQTLLTVRGIFREARKNLFHSDFILVFGFNHIYASFFLKKKLNIPVVFAIRSDILESRKIELESKYLSRHNGFISIIKKKLYLSIVHYFAKIAYINSDQIIVQNKKEYKKLVEGYGLDKSKVNIIHNNINFLSPHNKPLENKSLYLRSIIFVGSLSNRKGIMILLHAIRDLNKEGIPIKLDILGDGELRSYVETFIKLNSMMNTVKLHGYVGDPLKYIASSDLLIMPSLYDSFPNTILEALSVGTPVIGSDVGGITEILNNKALLFEPNSSIAIKNKVKYLYNPQNYKICKQECAKRREKFIFDWTGAFEKVFEKI